MLWEKAEQIDTNKCEDIKCYLAAIAKHEAINERNKIRPHVELDENVIGNSAKVFADIELREVIYSALQQLKTEYQIILLKYYYQEKLIREIASEEGIPESTVKTKLKRGREKLREILNEYEKYELNTVFSAANTEKVVIFKTMKTKLMRFKLVWKNTKQRSFG